MNEETNSAPQIELHKLAEQLFPIARSITGPAIRESARILSAAIPLEAVEIRTGEEILDWIAPPEWQLIRGRLWDPKGNLVIDSNLNSLHVVNFSESFLGFVSREELEDHLFSLKEQPEAIPYVTSYYERRWGFCVSERTKETLGSGRYRVEIQTRISPGYLSYWKTTLPAESPTDETVLISTYLCHPNLGNNELSGPLALTRVYAELSKRRRRFNYLFLVAPETIGSLAFLSQTSSEQLRNFVGGVVLTCLGGPSRTLSIKMSRSHWLGRPTKLDRVCKDFAESLPDDFVWREFDPSEGSDERQFCSPGFNLPVVQAAKTVYGQYPEYHTSLDDLEFMDINQVEKSASQILDLLVAFEVANLYPVSRNQMGEPFLSKKGLYPDLNFVGAHTNRTKQSVRMKIISLSDGSRTTQEIWTKLGESPVGVVQEVLNLEKAELLGIASERTK